MSRPRTNKLDPFKGTLIICCLGFDYIAGQHYSRLKEEGYTGGQIIFDA